MTRPPEEQPTYQTPTGRTISALSLHHLLNAGHINDTEIISDEKRHIQRMITPEGAYELVEHK